VDPNAPPPPGPPGGGGSGGGSGGGGSGPGTPGGPANPGGTTPAPGGSGPQIGRLRTHVAGRQRGTVLRGTVTMPAGSRVVVKALVSSRALAARPPRRRRLVRVGSTATGRASFAVRLNADARAALQRLGRLAVTLGITIQPSGGRSVTRTATVVLRPSRAA
ncbi:MAG TPA: hypothetical protein VK506_05875, partial [Conexibacter sp.]|nr:hypothetical protein [Conexibacter sp.]